MAENNPIEDMCLEEGETPWKHIQPRTKMESKVTIALTNSRAHGHK